MHLLSWLGFLPALLSPHHAVNGEVLVLGSPSLVSRTSAGGQVFGCHDPCFDAAGINFQCEGPGHPSVSDSGARVVFSTEAEGVDLNPIAPIPPCNDRLHYLRDRTAQTTALMSYTELGGSPNTSKGKSEFAMVSGCGQGLTFSDRNPDGSVSQINVFLRDLTQGTTTLISHGASPNQPATGGVSVSPRLSNMLSFSDTNYWRVAFESEAGDLALAQPAALEGRNVFVRDTRRSSATWISRDASNLQARELSPGVWPTHDFADISADGAFVTWRSDAVDLLSEGAPFGSGLKAQIFRRRADGVGGTTLISHVGVAPSSPSGSNKVGPPAISDDGSRIVFSSEAKDLVLPALAPTAVRQIYLWDSATGLSLVSKSDLGIPARRPCGRPRISGDGRIVVYITQARNLTQDPSDAPGTFDVYAYDTHCDRTYLVTQNTTRSCGLVDIGFDGLSYWIAFSTDTADPDLIPGLFDTCCDAGTPPANCPTDTPLVCAEGRDVYILEATLVAEPE